jgi:hypothetical protein
MVVCVAQSLLSKDMKSRQETLLLKDQLEACRRELLRQQAKIRTHQGDKEIKLAEMAQTIRRMSSTDLHSEVAVARQEVMTSKLTEAHLRADIDDYRNMLETEQLKLKQVRSELATAEMTIGAQQVFDTIRNIPGVEPAMLIEVMSGKLIQLQSDVEKQKTILQQAQTQIDSLQKLNMSSSTNAAPAGSARWSNRSPAPTGRSRSPLKHIHRDNFADDGNGDDEDDEMAVKTSAPFNLVVDGQATPQKVLDSLDTAILAQRIQLQEATISKY